MKDYLHLFGGMLAGIALLAAYIFGWSALMRCHGETIKSIAPDGVNEVTVEVDANGYVIGQSSTCLYVPEKYKAHPQYIPQTGEVVIIGDAPYVIISLAVWERWTNAVAWLEAVAERRWANEHKTDAGRRAWHGDLKERRQAEDGRGMVYTYADGFTYTEQAEPSRRVSPAVDRTRKAATKPQGASVARPRANIPPRLRAKQEAVSKRPAAKEVNATFGPGGKLLKVEGEE